MKILNSLTNYYSQILKKLSITKESSMKSYDNVRQYICTSTMTLPGGFIYSVACICCRCASNYSL